MKISYRFRKRYLWLFKTLRKGYKQFMWVGALGLLLAFFLTQAHITINQTPSLTYKAFICFKNLKPQRGDFVSIQDHPTAYFEDLHYTKRLMGLPGDQIYLKNNRMYVENTLAGSLQKTTKDGKLLHPLKITVIPEGYAFVSADHPRSFDSRYEEFGLVKEEHLRGRCFALLPAAEGSYQKSVISDQKE